MSLTWGILTNSKELLVFYSLFHIPLFYFVFMAHDRYRSMLKFLNFFLCFVVLLMLVVLVSSLLGFADFAFFVKDIFKLPNNSRDITQYGSGLLGNVALLDGIIVRHVLFFDQPSTFSSFIFILSLSVWLNKGFFSKLLLLIIIIAFTPSKIALILFIFALLIVYYIRSDFLRSLAIPIFLFLGFIAAYFLDFKIIDLADTLSARLYWTDLLFSGTAPWDLTSSCVGGSNSCVIGIYDGYLVKLPIILVALVFGLDKKYRVLADSILISSLFTLQYGTALFYVPLTVITYCFLKDYYARNEI
ncbi:MAG: hypothetical protein COA59_07230 [Colwellia sp.]|nr:MAG: hypothetical protein COA59_07230 [Colwellia sp.]